MASDANIATRFRYRLRDLCRVTFAAAVLLSLWRVGPAAVILLPFALVILLAVFGRLKTTLGAILVILTIPFAAKQGIDYSQILVERIRFQRALDIFTRTNPVSVADWKEKPFGWFGQGGRSRGWITYCDYDMDGSIDVKRFDYPSMGTNSLFWRDTDEDGMFDTLVDQGCFHRETHPLPTRVPVPRLTPPNLAAPSPAR